jgi:uncharacterized OsmC-like protein
MNPIEMLLRALGSCHSNVAKSFAKAHGIDLHNFLVVLEGDLDPTAFCRVNLESGPAARRFALLSILKPTPQAKIAKFVDFIKSWCPVGNTLLNGVNIGQRDVAVARSKVYASRESSTNFL